MNRDNSLIIKILAFFMAMPMLILACSAIGLFLYLALTLAGTTTDIDTESEAVRIRTVPELTLISPAPAINEAVVEIEDSVAVETSAELVVSAPTLFEIDEPDQVSNAPVPVEEATPVSEPVTPTESETVVEDTTIQAVPAPDDAEIADPETQPPPEESPVVEISAEPVKVEQRPLPEIEVNPAPIPEEAPKSDFVPDSSFFDQLLNQVD